MHSEVLWPGRHGIEACSLSNGHDAVTGPFWPEAGLELGERLIRAPCSQDSAEATFPVFPVDERAAVPPLAARAHGWPPDDDG